MHISGGHKDTWDGRFVPIYFITIRISIRLALYPATLDQCDWFPFGNGAGGQCTHIAFWPGCGGLSGRGQGPAGQALGSLHLEKKGCASRRTFGCLVRSLGLLTYTIDVFAPFEVLVMVSSCASPSAIPFSIGTFINLNFRYYICIYPL